MKSGRATEFSLLLFLFAFLGYFYLFPGMDIAFMGKKDQVMSDGTDPATLPYQYAVVKYHLTNSPSQLFFGAIPNPFAEAPEGNTLWMPWNEKIIASLLLPFVSLEQLSSWMVYILLILNALAAYWFGRSQGWPKPICIAIAICWAFNPYTRARARVHMSLSGIYFLPLIFVGLNYIKNFADRRTLILAGLALLGAATIAQYYLIMAAFLAPVFLVYLFWDKGPLNTTTLLTRLTIGALPAILFAGWCYLMPVPPSFVKPGLKALPVTGEMKDKTGIHPFLKVFASRPLDYFAGDIGIGLADWNPLRKGVSEHIVANLGDGNTHERTNGIRWTLLFLFGFGIYLLFAKPKDELSPTTKNNIIYFGGLAAAGFLLSLAPDFLGGNFMPSAWLHGLVSQFRVPSRAGVFVHFGVMSVAAFVLLHLFYKPFVVVLKKKSKKDQAEQPLPAQPLRWERKNTPWARRLTLPFVFSLIVVIDFPPALNAMPIVPVLPPYGALTGQGSTPCGFGMHFPYVSPGHALREMYYFAQRMRGSECKILNGAQVEARNLKMMQSFAYVPKLFDMIKQGDRTIATRLVQVAHCVPMEWIVFDQQLPSDFGPSICKELGWEWFAPDICRDKVRGKPLERLPELCLN